MSAPKQQISLRLAQIAGALSDTLPESSPALCIGNMGEVLFLMYYSRYTAEEQWYNCATDRLEQLFEQIENQQTFDGAFGAGLSGTFYAIEHLIQQYFIDASARESLAIFDDFLVKSMRRRLQKSDFDYFSGATGIGAYLLERLPFQPALHGALDELLEAYAQHAQSDGAGGIFWETTFSRPDGAREVNVGLTHGMLSQVLLLARLCKAGIAPARCRTLLEGAVSFLLRQEQDVAQYYALFPNVAGVPATSRLGWCYGDLGVALGLYRAGQACERPDWIEKSIDVFQYTATRRDLRANMVNDAAFCHGACGIAQFFQRMYIETGIPEFQATWQYWIQQTLAMARPNTGIAGYLPHIAMAQIPPENTRSLLNGVSGIGLSLICADSDIPPDWDACFLLS